MYQMLIHSSAAIPSQLVKRVMLKAISKTKGNSKTKTDLKNFTLSNIDTELVCASQDI